MAEFFFGKNLNDGFKLMILNTVLCFKTYCMAIKNRLKNQHLLWRAGFGPAVEQLEELEKYSPEQYYKALVKASDKKPEYINVASDDLKNIYEISLDAGRKKNLTAEDRKELNRLQRDAIKNLNLYWFKEMVTSSAQLREKMAFFWHGHFASRNNNVYYNQLLLQVFREHGLGSLRRLLKEVSHSASMLFFLNNQQNKKGHPNENFAREVMELFTLGRGNYTENDIKEAARAFTGWSANPNGSFVFRKGQHDDGSKTVLGKTGRLDGDDVLNILLDNRQAARFITQKIYRFFVNDKPDTTIVNSLADIFYKSDYNISKLMEDIFTSDWFYIDKNIGSHIKSPIELLVGIQRMIPMQLDNDNVMMNLQRILGQQLLFPPNVAGWPGGKSWIDSSTLMTRMRIPQMFADKDELNLTPKQDDDQMMGRKNDGTANVPTVGKKKAASAGMIIKAKMDWPQYISKLESVKREDLIPKIKQTLFQANTDVDKSLPGTIDASSRESYIKSVTIQLMSTPEYQLS